LNSSSPLELSLLKSDTKLLLSFSGL
jgi:hypothetical protein